MFSLITIILALILKRTNLHISSHAVDLMSNIAVRNQYFSTSELVSIVVRLC